MSRWTAADLAALRKAGRALDSDARYRGPAGPHNPATALRFALADLRNLAGWTLRIPDLTDEDRQVAETEVWRAYSDARWSRLP